MARSIDACHEEERDKTFLYLFAILNSMATRKLQIYHGTSPIDTHKIIAETTAPPHGVCLNIFHGFKVIARPLENLERLGIKIFIDNGSFERFRSFLDKEISEKDYFSEDEAVKYFKKITEEYALLFQASKKPQNLIITLPEVIANAKMTQNLQEQYMPIYKKWQDKYGFQIIVAMQFDPRSPEWIEQMQGSALALSKIVKPADEDGARVGVPFGNDFRSIQKPAAFENINKEFQPGAILEGRTAHLFASGTPTKLKKFGKPWVESVDASSLNKWAIDAHYFMKTTGKVIDVRDMRGIPKVPKPWSYCSRCKKTYQVKIKELKTCPKCGETPIPIWTPTQIENAKKKIPIARAALRSEGIVMEDWYDNNKTSINERFRINLENFDHVMKSVKRPNASNRASVSLANGIRTEKQLLYYLKAQGIIDGKSQLKRGIKIEMEHTNNPRKARRIAMDHLVEFPTYYRKKTGLPALEVSLEQQRLNRAKASWRYIVRSPTGLIFNMDDVRKRLDASGLSIEKVTEKFGNHDWIYELSIKVSPVDPAKLKRVEKSIDKYITDHTEDRGKRSIIVQASRSGDTLLFIIEDGISFLIDSTTENPLET